jgi:hypothetical protein
MVKFRFPRAHGTARAAIYYQCGNHVRALKWAGNIDPLRVSKFLINFELLKFDEKSR